MKEQLAPYQENNMGDCPKEYLEFFDEEESNFNNYNEDTISMVQEVESGASHNLYQDRFKVLISRNGMPSSCYVAPIGHRVIEVPANVVYPSFDKYMSEYVQIERNKETGRYGYWDNPNKRWDWFVIGGRWTGYFKLKTLKLLPSDELSFDYNGFSFGEVQNFIELHNNNREKFKETIATYGMEKYGSIAEAMLRYKEVVYPEHGVGRRGIGASSVRIGYADMAYKKDIDFEGMRREAAEEAEIEYDKATDVFGDSLSYFVRWEFVRDSMFKGNIDKARKYYNCQEAVNIAWKNMEAGLSHEVESYLCTKEEFIKRKVGFAIPTFAVVKDSEWYEKGEMGWWGVVSNEKDQDEWNEEFNKMLDSLPDDTLLTLVDAHI